jgi:hypothetical protein
MDEYGLTRNTIPLIVFGVVGLWLAVWLANRCRKDRER